MGEYAQEWLKELDERQRKEVEFALIYADGFAHGTDGHNRLLLIAKLARMLDEAENKTKE
jgi:hypothetical protein